MKKIEKELRELIERWAYCMGCGERTVQKKVNDGWVCDCGKVNLR